MTHHLLSRTIKHIFENRFHRVVINYPLIQHISSSATESPIKGKFRYIKYLGITLGGTIIFSFVYKVYAWTVQVPICPNFHRNQDININNVLACTALVRNLEKQCSGDSPMEKIGAATGVNFKLLKAKSENINFSTKIILNDNDIAQRNIFDVKYMLDYLETLVDLLWKLDEIHCIRLLSNIIGYYIFVCPECHSTIIRQMISCTSYLNQSGLQTNAADISEIETQKNNN